MRDDFAKLITECVRVNAVDTYRSRRRQLNRSVNEDSIKGESIRKWAKMHYGGKEFGENLAPIKKFILSKVGQNWDEVHSEIAAVMDKNSTIKYHVWQHLMDYVEIHTYMENGRVHYNPTRHAWRSNSPYYIEDSWALVYVHPVTKLLCKVRESGTRWTKYRATQTKEQTAVTLSKTSQLHKINGIWYEITLVDTNDPAQQSALNAKSEMIGLQIRDNLPYRPFTPRGMDTNAWISTWLSKAVFGKETLFATNKRQLNSKELKKNNLKNDQIIKAA